MSRRLRIMWGVVLPILAVMTCSIGYNIGVRDERAQRNAYYNEQVARLVDAIEKRLALERASQQLLEDV